jgi:hypothetical protein
MANLASAVPWDSTYGFCKNPQVSCPVTNAMHHFAPLHFGLVYLRTVGQKVG